MRLQPVQFCVVYLLSSRHYVHPFMNIISFTLVNPERCNYPRFLDKDTEVT